MAKTETLEEVLCDGEVLVLSDGRRLVIDDLDDATLASIWLPPARIAMRAGLGQKLRVTNVETGETVAARLHLGG